MISSPAPPFQPLNQQAAKFQVWLGPADGSKPDASGRRFDLYPITNVSTANSRRDEVLTLGVLPGYSTVPRLQDCSLQSTFLNRQVEIRAESVNTLGDVFADTIIGWGVICRVPMQINGDQETFALEARIGDEHFGKRLESYPTWDPILGERRDVMTTLVFNPEIDGIIESNKNPKTDDDHDWNYIVDPESIRTDASRAVQGIGLFGFRSWKLSEAVLALCWWLNPSETYIKNPTLQDTQWAFGERDDLLKNVRIPIGTSLPEALDLLCVPLEYGWSLYHNLDESGNRYSQIVFHERGKGQKRALLMQRALEGRPDVPPVDAEDRDIRKTQVLSFDAQTSIVDLANRVICYGDIVKREVTVYLSMCWDPEYDTKRLSDLRDSTDFAKQHPEVGRKYVVDFAGDYVNLRPELMTPFNLEGVFGDTPLQIRRRRFIRCLSQHQDADDLESNGYRVDWFNHDAVGSVSYLDPEDKGWQRVKWPFSVLEKEAGIYFDGDVPPAQLWALVYAGTPENVHLRITATLMGDVRVKGDAMRRASSPNKIDVTLTLDLADKFQDSQVVTSGDFKSIFATYPTDARDDTEAIQTYAEDIQDASDAIRLDTSIPLEGALHPEYQIGDILPIISGRSIDLKLANNRYPQIVGIVHHFQQQQVELLLESFKRERPRIVHGTIPDVPAPPAVAAKPLPNASRPHFRRPRTV